MRPYVATNDSIMTAKRDGVRHTSLKAVVAMTAAAQCERGARLRMSVSAQLAGEESTRPSDEEKGFIWEHI